MIRKISVNGFRSLRRFSMAINRGLNVLVGPNGAGKTNIILFFEFVRLANSAGVREAVSRMGGAGQVFQKRGKERFCDLIEYSLTGAVRSGEDNYEYIIGCTIRASTAAQEVYYESQRVQIWREGSRSSYIDVIWGASEAELTFKSFPETSSSSLHLRRADLEKYLNQEMFLQHSLATYIQHADPVVAEVCADLSVRFLLNVVPSIVKSPEDSTRQPGIDSDGSGLSATLYAIKRKKIVPEISVRTFFHRIEPKMASWAHVLSLIKVAVPTIEDIDVENEPFDNNLRTKVTVGRGNTKAVLPLSAMSDGTVKWMSLVVRLATSRAALLLEEPENYLHPLMQREVVRLLRESVAEDGFVLVSTHSETLLNALKVEELVVVSYSAGGTRAKRVSNAAELNQEIESTGFGLGYYLLADAVRS